MILELSLKKANYEKGQVSGILFLLNLFENKPLKDWKRLWKSAMG